MTGALMSPRVRRYTRARALLAGLLVFGVGSSVTLASWSDSEAASGEFLSGVFSIEGSPTGVFAAQSPGTPDTSLKFSMGSSHMWPGSTGYALFSIKTAAASVAGQVLLAADPNNNRALGQYLQYGVRLVAGSSCTQQTFAAGTDVVPVGSALTRSQTTTALPVAPNGGSQVNYCFAVTLPTTAPSAAQGQSVTPSWSFFGTSTPG